MGKRGNSSKKDKGNPKRRHRGDDGHDPENVDDEIDIFHMQRDVVPLDINGDCGHSDDDVVRRQKQTRAKFGGVEDEMHDEEDENEGEKEERDLLGDIKSRHYGGDNHDFELHSSDDEAPREEEEEVKEMQKERAKNLSIEDFGLEDSSEDETNRELTLEEMSLNGKDGKLSLVSEEPVDELVTFEEVKKDLNALSKEEQMDVVHRNHTILWRCCEQLACHISIPLINNKGPTKSILPVLSNGKIEISFLSS